MSNKINLTCPHCGSTLKVDTEAAVVVGHSPPVQHREKADFDKRLQQIESEKERSADIMAEEAANQKKRARQKAARAGAKVEKNW